MIKSELLIAFVKTELISRLRMIKNKSQQLTLSTDIIDLLAGINAEASDGIEHWNSLLEDPEWWKEFFSTHRFS